MSNDDEGDDYITLKSRASCEKSQTRIISFNLKITKKGNKITLQRKGLCVIEKRKYRKMIEKYEKIIRKYERSIEELTEDLIKLSEIRNELFIDIKMGL